MVVGTVGFGVGFCGGEDPLRLSHDRTSDTLDIRASSLGYLEEEYCSVCQRTPSSSMYVSVPIIRQRPREGSLNVWPTRSMPVSVVGLCLVELVFGIGGGVGTLWESFCRNVLRFCRQSRKSACAVELVVRDGVSKLAASFSVSKSN